jgi:hypothetical protein
MIKKYFIQITSPYMCENKNKYTIFYTKVTIFYCLKNI